MIFIIVAYGAAKPIDDEESRGIKATIRQAVEPVVPVEAVPAPTKPAATDDDDDVDILGLLAGDDDGL